MARCEVCGNDYGKVFTVARDSEEHVFDSCAHGARASAARDRV
jgi:hypothetical protein